MILPRVIPVLLLEGRGLVKGTSFSRHVYVGDPINTVRIFDSKEVDELLILDIAATREKRLPPVDLVTKVSDQCLMPFGVGGGVASVADARVLLKAGAEKVCLNTAALERPDLVAEIAGEFGSQSVMVSLDVKRSWRGRPEVFVRQGRAKVSTDLAATARLMEEKGAGEILVNDIARDGTLRGYDLDLVSLVAGAVSVPVIALGGAASIEDFRGAFGAGAQAGAAGAMFVFHGPRRAVLVTYPDKDELAALRGR